MAGETFSTNMNLPIPGVAITDGPQWAEDINDALEIIDAHDHTAGAGVAITPDAINITTDLPFNGYSVTLLKKATFSSQSGALTGTNFLSFVGGNLYVNDGSGNQVQVTSGGGVAGSPGSIGSLTAPASATYSAGSKTFTWSADSGKAAAMDNGAVIIRETNVASAKGITLASPSSLSADFQLTLPSALPGSTQYLTSTNLGVLSYSTADNIGSAMTSTGSNAIGSVMTATGANAISAARTTTVTTNGSDPGIGGISISASSSTFSTSSTSYVDVTNVSCQITTSGRPICVKIVPQAGASGTFFGLSTGPSAATGVKFAQFSILRGSTQVGTIIIGGTLNASGQHDATPSMEVIDAQAAGTYTYKLQAAMSSAYTDTLVEARQLKMVVYEL